MKLTKLEMENYKSIRAPVTAAFSDELPTVLIGRNGSGKTNILIFILILNSLCGII